MPNRQNLEAMFMKMSELIHPTKKKIYELACALQQPEGTKSNRDMHSCTGLICGLMSFNSFNQTSNTKQEQKKEKRGRKANWAYPSSGE
jgi:hypothetical protein